MAQPKPENLLKSYAEYIKQYSHLAGEDLGLTFAYPLYIAEMKTLNSMANAYGQNVEADISRNINNDDDDEEDDDDDDVVFEELSRAQREALRVEAERIVTGEFDGESSLFSEHEPEEIDEGLVAFPMHVASPLLFFAWQNYHLKKVVNDLLRGKTNPVARVLVDAAKKEQEKEDRQNQSVSELLDTINWSVTKLHLLHRQGILTDEAHERAKVLLLNRGVRRDAAPEPKDEEAHEPKVATRPRRLRLSRKKR